MAVGGILAAAFYLAQDRRTRWRLLGAAAVILPILLFVIWPRLEDMTAGVIGERFGDTQLTGRDLLIKGDLESWSENSRSRGAAASLSWDERRRCAAWKPWRSQPISKW